MPSLHFPLPISTSDPDSFARKTFQERLPKILDAVLAQNDYPASIRYDLLSLKAELNQPAPLIPLASTQPEYGSWNARLDAYPNKNWLDLPFYFAEAFFYRRLLEAVQYFVPGAWQVVDPFQSAKDAQALKDIHLFKNALETLTFQPAEIQCETLLYYCLWGNVVDLSNLLGDFENSLHQPAGHDHLIINHAKEITRFLSKGVRSIAYILDNVGIELYFDLGLIDFLLQQNWVEQVTIYLKNCPFFVSDAMPKDLLASVQQLIVSPNLSVSQVGQRLEESISNGRIKFNSDLFWTSSMTYMDAPAEINRILANAGLAIFKGDLNFRRLLGDYHWDSTTQLEDILIYLRMPVVVMRTLKSQIAAGLSAEQVNHLNETDLKWLINGKYGVIQLISL